MPSPSRPDARALMRRRTRLGRAAAAGVTLSSGIAAACATWAAAPQPGHPISTSVAGAPAILPPDGTYAYAFARNGTEQGKATVAYFRRAKPDRLEADEASAVGALRAHVVATFRASDLGADAYVATYQAPFERSSPLGAAEAAHGRGFFDQTTVRYADGATTATYTIDGDATERAIAALPPVPGAPKGARPFLADAPLLASALLVPAYRHHSGDGNLAPLLLALGDGHPSIVGGHIVRAVPRAQKVPKNDVALEYPGYATYWYDAHTFVVHEIYFEALNLDAHLVSYAKIAAPAPFAPQPTPTPEAPYPSADVTFDGTGNATIAGVRIDPPKAKQPYPAVVLVAPPVPSPPTRRFGGDGPEPMFPALARAFADRGYAVLLYDQRGAGKTAGSPAASWDESLSDVQAAIGSLFDSDGIDKSRVYVLGYGLGADLALAAAADPETKLAGAIALEPSVVPYRTAFEHASHPLGPWEKSALNHDPTVLVTRVKAPLFVLQSGVESPARAKDDVRAYDDRVHAANQRATVVVASDLTTRFGGLYDADAAADTEALFPYRFDPSTATALVDWLDSPKGSAPGAATQPGVPAPTPIPPSLRQQATPPPPPPPLQH